MSRLMSVSLTEAAVRARIKTVTRRTGWKFLKPGDTLTLCRKVMGRRKGEPLERIAEVEVVSVSREKLSEITDAEVDREGFNHEVTPPEEFIQFFIGTHKGVRRDSEITRIEWRYL